MSKPQPRPRAEGLTPAERKLRAQIAVETSWANTVDRSSRTQPGRDAFLAKLEREVDPDGTCTPEDRRRRAEHLRRAHMQRIALKSAKARRLKAQGSRGAQPAAQDLGEASGGAA